MIADLLVIGTFAVLIACILVAFVIWILCLVDLFENLAEYLDGEDE